MFVVLFGVIWIPFSHIISSLKATGMGWRGPLNYGPIEADYYQYLFIFLVPYFAILLLTIILFLKSKTNATKKAKNHEKDQLLPSCQKLEDRRR